MKHMQADIIQELGPFEDAPRIHGVSYDGQNIWFASGTKLHAVDPSNGKKKRALAIAATAGTAFDGEHIYQIADGRIHKIDLETGDVLSTIPAPHPGDNSGLTWAEGFLWVGEYRGHQIHQLDPATGAILNTLASPRFVTGVTWVDGNLWHATLEDGQSDLRCVDPATGETLALLELPADTAVSGIESDGKDRLFCGGGNSGKVRVVRRPKI